MIALSSDEAKLENMHEDLLKLLKNPHIDPVYKRGLYEDALKRISIFKMGVDHRQPPAVVTATRPVEDDNGERETEKRRTDGDLPDIEMRTPSPIHPPLPSSPEHSQEPIDRKHLTVSRLPRNKAVSATRVKKRGLTDYVSDKRKRNFATAMLSSQLNPPKMRALDEEPPLSGLLDKNHTEGPPGIPSGTSEPPVRHSDRRPKLPALPNLLARDPTIKIPRGKKRPPSDVLPTSRKRTFGTTLVSFQSRPTKIHTSHFDQKGDGRMHISSWRL